VELLLRSLLSAMLLVGRKTEEGRRLRFKARGETRVARADGKREATRGLLDGPQCWDLELWEKWSYFWERSLELSWKISLTVSGNVQCAMWAFAGGGWEGEQKLGSRAPLGETILYVEVCKVLYGAYGTIKVRS
jgi:hypothetical protein